MSSTNNSLKTIAIFFQHFPPFPNAGARRAESVIDGLLEIKSYDTRLQLYTTFLGKKPDISIDHKVFRDLPSGNKTNKYLRFFLEIWLGLKICLDSLAKTKPNLFMISSPSFFAAIVISLYCRLRSIHYILEVRDAHPDGMIASGVLKENTVIYKVFTFFGKIMYSNAQKIIASNEGIANRLRAYTKSNIEVIFNGFPDKMVEVKKIKYEKFTLCFHGILALFQDVPSLVRIIQLLCDTEINIIVIGYGPKEGLLKSLSQKNFSYLGKLDPDRTLEVISKCHLGISIRTDDPISRDSFPVKIWEYIGAKIPSIVVPKSEAGDFLEANKIGLQFNSGREKEIVNKIIELSKDHDHYKIYKDNIDRQSSFYLRSVTGRQVAQSILEFF
jgi:glycosyltransferase involved in cell wall biosynthesis